MRDEKQNITMENSVLGAQVVSFDKPQRNSFLTFWLRFCIVATIILFPLSLYFTNVQCIQIVNSLTWGEGNLELIQSIQNHYFWFYFCICAEALFMIIGYTKILKWKKSGFWLIIGTRAAMLVLYAILLSMISSKLSDSFIQLKESTILTPTIIISVVSVGLLWAFLQLKKDGISCWYQLK